MIKSLLMPQNFNYTTQQIYSNEAWIFMSESLDHSLDQTVSKRIH